MSIEATHDAVTGTQPTVRDDGVAQPATSVTYPQPPVLITEHEVMLGTAAALAPPPARISQRMLDALRVAVGAFRLPPPRVRYSHDAAYIERARMAREMERL